MRQCFLLLTRWLLKIGVFIRSSVNSSTEIAFIQEVPSKTGLPSKEVYTSFLIVFRDIYSMLI